MLILITGGAGFIGRHTTAALLDAGHAVRVLDNLDPQVHGHDPTPLDTRVELIRGDVRDPSSLDRALDGVNAVLHLASLTGVGQSMHDIHSYSDVNIGGTSALLDRIVKSGTTLTRLVVSSSRAVYGEGAYRCPNCGLIAVEGRPREQLELGDFAVYCPTCANRVELAPTDESHRFAPLSVYGLTKRVQEDLCLHVGATHDIPVTVLRYFNVYGAGQSLVNPYTGIVSIFYSRVTSGRPISVYEQGLPVRDFVHVSDVVRANVAALTQTDRPNTVYNVGTGHASTIADVAEGLAAALQRDVELQVGDEYRVGDIFGCVATTERLESGLDVRARVGLRVGLADFVTWARDQTAVDRYDDMVTELRSFGLMHRDAGQG